MSSVDDLIPIQREDHAWFAQNPGRQFRIRRAKSVEYSDAPTDGVWIFAIVHRDNVEDYWEHEFFKEPQYSDFSWVSDDIIRKVLHEISGKKC